MIPFVTVSVNVPSGLPIAIAVWPTWIVVGVADAWRPSGRSRRP